MQVSGRFIGDLTPAAYLENVHGMKARHVANCMKDVGTAEQAWTSEKVDDISDIYILSKVGVFVDRRGSCLS